MTQSKYTTKLRSFKHLQLGQRGQLSAYHEIGLSSREIGAKLGCSHSTVLRELRRGEVIQLSSDLKEKLVYFPDSGQRVYKENRSNCGTKYKLAEVSNFLDHAEKKIIKNKWSPDVIVGEYRINPETAGLPSICTKTLYNYIDKGLLNIKNIDLLLKVSRKTKNKRCRVNKRILGDSIETRPPEVATRETFGHWEIDTVLSGRAGGQSLLTLLERRTRTFIIRQLNEHTVECVNKAVFALKVEYKDEFSDVFRTITADNGSEFYGLAAQLDPLGSKAYFCHPYSSWEKGANEKHNSLIRRFLPKGKSFENLTPETVNRIQNWCNSLPRKILGYLTPQQAFDREMLAIA